MLHRTHLGSLSRKRKKLQRLTKIYIQLRIENERGKYLFVQHPWGSKIVTPLRFCAAAILSPLLLEFNYPSYPSIPVKLDLPVSTIKKVEPSKNLSKHLMSSSVKKAQKARHNGKDMQNAIVPLSADVASIDVSVVPIGSKIIAQLNQENHLKLPHIRIVKIAPVVASVPTYTQMGIASWYGSAVGSCANKTAPMGTVIKVKVLSTGAVITCKVDDRGPYVAGRVIDLSPDVFGSVANLGTGLIPVQISW